MAFQFASAVLGSQPLRRKKILAFCLVALLLQSSKCKSVVLDDDGLNPDEDLEAYDGHKTCSITGHPPRKPRALTFCNRFNDNACCIPGIDVDDHVYFMEMMDNGISCRIRGDVRRHPIARMYCMNCDPNQPKYVRPVEYDPSIINDDAEDTDERDSTLLVCRGYMKETFGDFTMFDDCGMLVSEPCLGLVLDDGDIEEIVIDDRDRYTCGDEYIVPSSEFDFDLDDEEEYDESLELFLNFRSLNSPELDVRFGFRVVYEDDCEDDDIENADHPLQPSCLMTFEQRNFEFRVNLTGEEWGGVAYCEDDDNVDDDEYGAKCARIEPETCYKAARSSGSLEFAASVLVAFSSVIAIFVV
eukprot:gene73-3469_t